MNLEEETGDVVMGKKLVRFAVIGTSKITENFLSAAKDIEGFKLAAVYSRSREKGEEFAKNHGVEQVFTSLDEMAESSMIDAVYIASPNAYHCRQAIMMMKGKKHVLCEKAFASNLIEVEEMIKTAKENNVLLMEAMKNTFLPNFQAVKENIHKIGKVRRYSASYCQYSSRYDKYREGVVLNAFKRELSNGSLMDIGVYTIAPMIALFGSPKSIKANGYILESGVDGEGSAIFEYDNMLANVAYSKISDSYLPTEIQGEDGTILIDAINGITNVKIKYRDGREEDITRKQHLNTMYYEIEEFINLINNSIFESEINSFEFSKNVMFIMDECRRQIGLKYPAD